MKAVKKIMKAIRCWYLMVLLLMVTVIVPLQFSSAQVVAPYAVSPKWMVGRTSGMNFVQVDNSIGNPVNMTGNPAANGGQEATSSLCSPDKNMFLYCNNAQIYSTTNGLIGNVNSNNGQSSTQGAVTLPDPANPNRAYVFSGNDLTGGNQGGINWYLYEKTGATYSLISGPNSIAASSEVNEGLVVSADGANGYWVISHNRVFPPDPHLYFAWHVTGAGVGTRVTSPSSSRGGSGAGGTIKISKCQTRIAMIGSQEVEVYNWNKATGRTDGLIRFSGSSAISNGYGGEFSPNGALLYFASLNGNLQQWNLSQPFATGVVPITGASGIGGMSLGPNDRIYIAKSSTTISAINAPNSVGDACTYVNSALTVTGTGPYIGLSNSAWLNPNLPEIQYSISCLTVDFSHEFQTYFLDDITVNASSFEWNFGDGGGWQTGLGLTPTHVYASSGTYTVRVRFNDAACTQQWTATTSVVLSCVVAPVSLTSFTGNYHNGQTDLAWATVTEKNNDYFVVERSDDGIYFYPVGMVKGAGSSSAYHSYSLTDTKESIGITYYRLVQYDFDGTKNYSEIIQTKNEEARVSVSPNPFMDSFTITFAGSKSSQIRILDILGRVVETRSMEQESYILSMGEHLTKGTYIVHVQTDQENYTYKLIKE